MLVDSYSGWFEIDQLHNTTSATLVTKLKCHFATHGAPQELMTDNAASFTSREFQEFACRWDFRHITSSPHYPQSNGLAERAVRSAKHMLEKCARDGTDIYAALLNLRNTPRDGLPSPAQRLFSRRTKALIPMTKAMYVPKVETQIQVALTQARQRGKAHYDRSAAPLGPLQTGQTVRMQTTRGYDRLATVLGRAPQPNSYQIQAGDATYIRNRRHLLQTPESHVPSSTAEAPAPATATTPPPNPQHDGEPRVAQAQAPVVITRSGSVKTQLPLQGLHCVDLDCYTHLILLVPVRDCSHSFHCSLFCLKKKQQKNIVHVICECDNVILCQRDVIFGTLFGISFCTWFANSTCYGPMFSIGIITVNAYALWQF